MKKLFWILLAIYGTLQVFGSIYLVSYLEHTYDSGLWWFTPTVFTVVMIGIVGGIVITGVSIGKIAIDMDI